MEDRLGNLDKCREVGKWLEVGNTQDMGKIQVEGKIHPMVHMDHAETSHGDYDDHDNYT